MEPNQPNSNTGNWNQPQFGKDIPGATAAMVLGIVSLVFSTVVNCCYFIGIFPGLVTSIIGLVLGSRATKLYNTEPNLYNLSSFKQAKAGKIMSLIALILCGLFIILFIFVLALGMMSEFDKYNQFN